MLRIALQVRRLIFRISEVQLRLIIIIYMGARVDDVLCRVHFLIRRPADNAREKKIGKKIDGASAAAGSSAGGKWHSDPNRTRFMAQREMRQKRGIL